MPFSPVLSSGKGLEKRLDTDTTAKDILRARNRLKQIEEERERLPDDAFAARADLLDEEHELRAHIAELRNDGEALAEPGKGSA